MTSAGPGASPSEAVPPPAPAQPGSHRHGSHRHGSRGYFIPGIIALLVMAAIGGAVNFGGLDHQSPSRLDGSNVAVEISQGLQAERHLATPPRVTCPPSEPVRAGLSFTCHWRGPGRDQAVRVTETDRRGQYGFSVPGPG